MRTFRGLGLEVMASSDNVLRGGLTGKHVDVPELLETVDFAPSAVPVVPTRVTELGQHVWEPPFTEFALQRVEIAVGAEPMPLIQNGPLLVLAVSGSVLLDSPRGDMVLQPRRLRFCPGRREPRHGPRPCGGFRPCTGARQWFSPSQWPANPLLDTRHTIPALTGQIMPL